MPGPVLVTGPLPHGTCMLIRGVGETNKHPQKKKKENTRVIRAVQIVKAVSLR